MSNLIVTDIWNPNGPDCTETGEPRGRGRPRHPEVDLAVEMVLSGAIDPATGRRITAKAAARTWGCGYRSVKRRLAHLGVRLSRRQAPSE